MEDVLDRSNTHHVLTHVDDICLAENSLCSRHERCERKRLSLDRYIFMLRHCSAL
jgi:hypothetical protein